jgi:hypothetical protein
MCSMQRISLLPEVPNNAIESSPWVPLLTLHSCGY